MNTGGWVMMISAVGGMTFFFAWCVHKVLTAPSADLHSQRDRTPDQSDPGLDGD